MVRELIKKFHLAGAVGREKDAVRDMFGDVYIVLRITCAHPFQ